MSDRGVAAVLIGIVIVVAGWWYFNVYDTAAGRCNRGDLGACMIYAAEQQAEQLRRIGQTPSP